jgi:hypothetical protein
MTFQIEYVNYAFPHHCARVCLFDGYGLRQLSAAMVLTLNGVL